MSTVLASHIARDKTKAAAEGTEPQLGRRAMLFFIVVLVLEILFVIYSLTLASRCAKVKGESQLLHYMVAVFFPWVYIFYAYLAGCSLKPF